MTDEIDSAIATEATLREAIELGIMLGFTDSEKLGIIAQAISKAYLRGITDGGHIAVRAIDEVLGPQTRAILN